MSGPYYGCDIGDCSTEMTYPASDLRVFQGKVVCEGCWDCHDLVSADFDNLPDELPRYCDLERFIPEGERKEYCVEFFRWWFNQPGANTEQGYDEWCRQGYPKAGTEGVTNELPSD